MEENVSPYVCHVFVCTNDRKGERKSCADGNGADIRKALKKEVNTRGVEGKGARVQVRLPGPLPERPQCYIVPAKDMVLRSSTIQCTGHHLRD
jgi:hypothetical protein